MTDGPTEQNERRGDELAARVRAARGWADMNRREMGEALGVSERQVTRLESGQAEVTLEISQRIAVATGVPTWFMEHGFAAPAEPEEPAFAERLETLEHQMGTVLDQLAIRFGAAAAAAASRPAPGGAKRGAPGRGHRQ